MEDSDDVPEPKPAKHSRTTSDNEEEDEEYPEDDTDPRNACPFHQRRYFFYCIVCKMSICEDCFDGVHNPHTFQNLAYSLEVYEEQFNKIKASYKEVHPNVWVNYDHYLG